MTSVPHKPRGRVLGCSCLDQRACVPRVRATGTGLFLLGGRPNRAAIAARGGLTIPMERAARARYTLSLR